jgi:hypothetical protein
MTGLLQRLARQAIGGGPSQVRPVARARFGEGLDTMAISQPEADALPEYRSAANHDHRQSNDLALTQANPALDGDRIRAIDQSRNVEHSALDGAAQSAARRARVDPLPLREGSAPISRSDDIDRAQAATRRPAAFVSAVHPISPTPLLAEQRVAQPSMASAPHPASEPAFPSSRAADSEPTEVHVHIGRIEVTAVQEPQPVKRPKTLGGHPSRSLADYLAGRRAS